MTLKPIKRLRKLGRRMHRLLAPPKPAVPPAPLINIANLQRKYVGRGLHLSPDRFVLYRIIGNDLYPRHSPGASRANVQFILQHEPPLADCEKRWVVNRIVDPAEERAIIDLLDRHQQSYLHLPFVQAEYARIGWDLDCFTEPQFLLAPPSPDSPDHHSLTEARSRHSKNAYVMNNNGARNAALRAGRGIAKWVLPWDGNCFVTGPAWAEIRAAVLAQPYLKYFVVPMARTVANEDLLAPDYRPQDYDEPQILFRRDAREEFDPAYVYGRRPKVELLWRLGVPGMWDKWQFAPWDRPKPKLSSEVHQFAKCGWVNRLESGRRELERHDFDARKRRGEARCSAIVMLLDRLDEDVMRRRLDPARLMLYSDRALDDLRAGGRGGPLGEIVASLEADANAAIARGTFSVLDKTGCAPSGDRQDYWHPAPYWWPDPSSPDGLPYIHRDGERRPGTGLYEPGSEEFDRSNLQRVLDGATICALAWRATGHRPYADHGAALIRRWFIDPRSRMNPHLRFAQARMGSKDNEGNRTGIIEMRDLCILLDAARLLARARALSEADCAAFRDWLRAYQDWLYTSPQGIEECRSRNNHGTYFDLQSTAIGAYLGDAACLVAAFRRSRTRINIQFNPDGSQPYELVRPSSLHYGCFNLQAWIDLATIAARCGEDLWTHQSATGGSLARGAEWLTQFDARRDWPYPQSDAFDWNRFMPIRAALARQALKEGVDVLEQHRTSPDYSGYFGIRPYWYL
ncbi:MAG TPA: alginate lyase family protein [Dongiaceae bacterium]|nr:alginate lyase family protein [Dongiaceae bacterium]